MSLQHQRQWINRSLVEIILWQVQGQGGKRGTLLRLGRQGSNRCLGMEIKHSCRITWFTLDSVAAGVSLMCIYNRLNFAGILFSVAQKSNFQSQQTFAVLWVGNQDIYQVIGPDLLQEFKWVLHSLFFSGIFAWSRYAYSMFRSSLFVIPYEIWYWLFTINSQKVFTF